jgi:hypothetical protein
MRKSDEIWREIRMNMCAKGAGNITNDLIKMGCESVDWIELAQDRLQWWTSMKKVITFKVTLRKEIS